MDTKDFLFPRDLEVSETRLERILVIGSCLAEAYKKNFIKINPDLICDFVLFNNAAKLPNSPPSPIESYQLQYVQIPLRNVVSDAIVRVGELEDEARVDEFYAMAVRNLDQFVDAALEYNVKYGILTLVSGFIVPQGHTASNLHVVNTDLDIRYIIENLNAHLASRVREFQNAYFANIEMIAASLGKRYFLDDSIAFYSHGSLLYKDWAGHERTPYWTAPERGRVEEITPLWQTYENRTDEYFAAVYRQIVFFYRAFHQIDMVKVVIFDLDNTLWRGQIAEHYQPGQRWPYVDGWPIGLWEAVHHLKARGILTSIASKNDLDLVRERWDSVVQPPFVKFSDFTNPQINWLPKAENVARILADFSLTPSSAVFVDDNPVERESVRAALPGIRAIGSDPFVTRRILLWAPETQVARLTTESRNRETLIKKQIERESDRSGVSREEFLASLGATVTFVEIGSLKQVEFTRVFELVNKTNQFNTNGKRWTLQEFADYLERGGRVLSFLVADKYSDYGLVGIVFIMGHEITQYVMSCRVLGLDVEVAVVDHIAEIIRSSHGYGRIDASIVHTAANSPCRELYTKAGFETASSVDGTDEYFLAEDRNPASAAHVRIVAAAAG